MKRQIYNLLRVSRRQGDASWIFDIFIISLILLNVVALVLETVPSIKQQYQRIFQLFEFFSVIIFSVEYVLRLWTANLNPEFKKPGLGNLKYAFTPLAIIDLLAILPFYLPFMGIDLRLLRVLRVFRLFRLFKIARYVSALNLMGKAVKEKKEELVVSLIFIAFLLLITSTLMYYVENDAQPEVFSSIPQTMWWGIATLTTVGYGDVYPITGAGKLLGGFIAVLGIGLFALPTGILASGFTEALAKKGGDGEVCHSCGQNLRE